MRLLMIGALVFGLTSGGFGHADAAAPGADVWREVTLPAGTRLVVVLDTAVGSDTSRVEQPVTAHLTHPISMHGQTVLAEGTRVSGVVTDATRSAKVKGRAQVAMRFDSLTPRGGDERYSIRTAPVGRMAPGTKEKDALEIAAPAAVGAIIGALLGGKTGALVGTAVAAAPGRRSSSRRAARKCICRRAPRSRSGWPRL
jgi:hypothetical protein